MLYHLSYTGKLFFGNEFVENNMRKQAKSKKNSTIYAPKEAFAERHLPPLRKR